MSRRLLLLLLLGLSGVEGFSGGVPAPLLTFSKGGTAPASAQPFFSGRCPSGRGLGVRSPGSLLRGTGWGLRMQAMAEGTGATGERYGGKYARRFEELVTKVSQYTPVEISAVKDARIRSVLVGVADALEEPRVRLAFRILYEDIRPLRFAGDVIFKIIDGMVKDEGKKLLELSERGDVSEEGVMQARSLFTMVDKDDNGVIDVREGGELLQELTRAGINVPWGDVESFMEQVDQDKNGKISFDEFAVGVESLLQLPEADQAAFLRLAGEGGGAGGEGDGKAGGKHYERYNEMLSAFAVWEEQGLARGDKGGGEDRMQAVLDGCFAGAGRPRVVEALRIVYCDFAPVRMGGDLIFTLLKQLVQRRTGRDSK